QVLVAELFRDGRAVGPAVEGLTYTSSNPAVVVVTDGVAVPVGDGAATITAAAAGRSASVQATVKDADKPFVYSFRNHIQSILTKNGCNSGACHGAAAGKKGFRLSLRGYDAEGDHLILTRQTRGRRVDLHDPSNSLIVTKATAVVPHGGGQRINPVSSEYQALVQWIAAGAVPPKPEDPRMTRLEVLPNSVVLPQQAVQQLIVRAHFSDGRIEDVTRWAKYTSADASVAQVDEHGKATVVGRGEGTITAWYLNFLEAATISAPYDVAPNDSAGAADVYAAVPKRNFIDVRATDKLKALNLPPSGPASDSEFLRRASLDVIGVLPTVAETQAFLADQSPDKRDRLIDALLARPEFVDYWTYKFCDLLLVNSEKLQPKAMWSYYTWIRNQVAADVPWDEFVRRLATAEGSTLENGAANFFVLHQDPLVASETLSIAFMGLSIGCAKCHNHPLEKWTNDQYFGMANLLARVRTKDLDAAGHSIVFSDVQGEVVQPLTGRPQPPRPLDGVALPFEGAGDRRAHLAKWLTAPENPYFTRAIVNRVWANFFGVGLVEAVDDLRLSNPASNPELLNELAARLVDDKFRLKALMKTILQSSTYQRSSVPLPANAGDKRFYSRAYPRRLMAEVLIDCISQVVESPTEFPGYPAGWRALQLPDSKVTSYFLDKF
ncbi:MAG: DUF1549 domain-containing protein, partial [Planctomycetia bacterium]